MLSEFGPIDEVRSRQSVESLPERELYELMSACQSRYRQKLQDQSHVQSLSAWMFACANSGKDDKPKLEDYQPFTEKKRARVDAVALSLLAEHWELVPPWVREMLAATGIEVKKESWDGLKRSASRIVGSPWLIGVDVCEVIDDLPSFQLLTINPAVDDFPDRIQTYPLDDGTPCGVLPGDVIGRMAWDGEIVSYGPLTKTSGLS